MIITRSLSCVYHSRTRVLYPDLEKCFGCLKCPDTDTVKKKTTPQILIPYIRPAQHTAGASFSCDPRELFLRPARTFSIAKTLLKPDVGSLNFVPDLLSNYNEIDFCGPRQIYVYQPGPSSFLSCAGLPYIIRIRRVTFSSLLSFVYLDHPMSLRSARAPTYEEITLLRNLHMTKLL